MALLISIARKKCCAGHYNKIYYNGGEIKGTGTVKKRKIGYDIPVRSKPVMSSVVWQQEENDIADEVKKLYHSISNSSKPVLFDDGNGAFPQADCDANIVENGDVKGQTIASSTRKCTKPFLKLNLNLGQNKTKHDGKRGRSSYERHLSSFLSKNQNELHAGTKKECVFMEEPARSKVQEWVENSARLSEKEREVLNFGNGKSEQRFEPEREVIKLQEKDETEEISSKDDLNVSKEIGHVVKNDDKQSFSELNIKHQDKLPLKSCLKKPTADMGKFQENCQEKSYEEFETRNETPRTKMEGLKPEEVEQKKLKFTESEEFKTARDVKKLIVTRWIDHSAVQNKSRLIEEESDTTLAEKSANELEYEDIDSILTSVSRMDDGRISKLKATDFYKELLNKKIKGYKSMEQKIDEVSIAIGEEMEVKEDAGQEKRISRSKRMTEEEGFFKGKECLSKFERKGKTKQTNDEREPLLESSIEDMSERKDRFNKLNKEVMENQENSFVSHYSNDENEITLKYSIVRNFSDRHKPMVYVSLQHIHGLGRTFGYNNSATARLYFANDSEEYEESDPIKCDDDIYLEEMFSVVGTSTKAILKDSLVVEIILEDSDEPELYVSVPLDGLRIKATLIDSVSFLVGHFELEG